MDEQHQREQVSKTQRKREMLARQDLGEALVALDEAQLAQLALPERLHEAILEAKRIGKFGALRRQLQYIGRLMREVDAAAIGARLENWKGPRQTLTAHQHALEKWRDRLLDNDAALTELAAAYPSADLQRLRQLVRSARRERMLASPPASYRALFQALKTIIPEPRQAPAQPSGAREPVPHAQGLEDDDRRRG